MKTGRFYGGSDDLFEAAGAFREEMGCYDTPGVFRLDSPAEGRLFVVGHYAPAGTDAATWCIGVQQVDEGDPIPPWPIRMTRGEVPYSIVLEIDLPDDAVLTSVNSDDEA